MNWGLCWWWWLVCYGLLGWTNVNWPWSQQTTIHQYSSSIRFQFYLWAISPIRLEAGDRRDRNVANLFNLGDRISWNWLLSKWVRVIWSIRSSDILLQNSRRTLPGEVLSVSLHIWRGETIRMYQWHGSWRKTLVQHPGWWWWSTCWGWRPLGLLSW